MRQHNWVVSDSATASARSQGAIHDDHAFCSLCGAQRWRTKMSSHYREKPGGMWKSKEIPCGDSGIGGRLIPYWPPYRPGRG